MLGLVCPSSAVSPALRLPGVRVSGPFSAPGRRSVVRAAKSDNHGDVEKRECDKCGGTGRVACYTCAPPELFAVPLRDGVLRKKKGEVDVLKFGFFGDVVAVKRCTTCTERPGELVCPRCRGKKFLLFRSAAWR
jgi:hypothetical protein